MLFRSFCTCVRFQRQVWLHVDIASEHVVSLGVSPPNTLGATEGVPNGAAPHSRVTLASAERGLALTFVRDFYHSGSSLNCFGVRRFGVVAPSIEHFCLPHGEMLKQAGAAGLWLDYHRSNNTVSCVPNSGYAGPVFNTGHFDSAFCAIAHDWGETTVLPTLFDEIGRAHV